MDDLEKNFIDGWIISYLKAARELTSKKRKELKGRFKEYLNRVGKTMSEVDEN